MRNRLLAFAFVFAALTGAAFLYQSVSPPVSSAQTGSATTAQTPPAQSAPSAAPSTVAPSTAAPALTAPGQGFDYGRARLENERNTVEIVQAFDNGIGFITAKSLGTQSDCDPTDFRCRFLQQQQRAQQGTGSGFVIDARRPARRSLIYGQPPTGPSNRARPRSNPSSRNRGPIFYR